MNQNFERYQDMYLHTRIKNITRLLTTDKNLNQPGLLKKKKNTVTLLQPKKILSLPNLDRMPADSYEKILTFLCCPGEVQD